MAQGAWIENRGRRDAIAGEVAPVDGQRPSVEIGPERQKVTHRRLRISQIVRLMKELSAGVNDDGIQVFGALWW
jgi:hypothetical protein